MIIKSKVFFSLVGKSRYDSCESFILLLIDYLSVKNLVLNTWSPVFLIFCTNYLFFEFGT